MPRENKSLFALLGVLSLRPSTGYEIKKSIEQSLVHFWHEGYGQIYPNLKRLVGEGLATMRTEHQQGKPDRNVYTITEKGRDTLQTWLLKPIDSVPAQKNELLLKLFFGNNVSDEVSLAHIEKHKKNMEQTLELYRLIEGVLTSEKCQDENKKYSLLTVRYGIQVAESIVGWCKESLVVLKNNGEG